MITHSYKIILFFSILRSFPQAMLKIKKLFFNKTKLKITPS
ncbi:Hypothetical protein Minf_1685 [Methylacidiphilum infernorum V4]|uniref:Uncharacterized protein n=1 Tax=Methylacidiphilum infernorum (isolate V4) TaxID=481448 RepID=B3DWS6_METI4|nr:Hypothetical protein Minf_1685 [Methylacidiphilum infernorum V4]